MNFKKKKFGKVLTSKFVGTGPSSYEKRIYRAAVSQRLRNTALGWYLLSLVQSTIALLVTDCTHRRRVVITNMLKPEYICVLLTLQRLRFNCCLIMSVTNFELFLSINQNPIVMGVCCGWRGQQYWAAWLYMGYLSYWFVFIPVGKSD